MRSNLSDKKIARVIFFLSNSRIILVDGFIKKTQSTPKQHLELAIDRKIKFQAMEKGYDK